MSRVQSPSDVVILDVGGKLYKTTQATLIRFSSYFEAMFSEHWSREDEEDGDERVKTIFIDKDPQPFQFILSYMREGCIQIPEEDMSLAKNIILQGEYFGLNDFISHVKAQAWQNGGKVCHSSWEGGDIIEDPDPLSAFDSTFESIIDAINQGFLPDAYFDLYHERINLQLGGTTFQISKKLIASKSDLLRNYFDSHPLKRNIYLEQDPKALAHLLQYIQYSQLDLPPDNPFLLRRILILAEYLKMTGFLVLIKARVMVNIEKNEAPMGFDPLIEYEHPCGPIRQITDLHRQYAANFDRRFSNFDDAFQTNYLPVRLFQ